LTSWSHPAPEGGLLQRKAASGSVISTSSQLGRKGGHKWQMANSKKESAKKLLGNAGRGAEALKSFTNFYKS
jgi:hypothetical protein